VTPETELEPAREPARAQAWERPLSASGNITILVHVVMDGEAALAARRMQGMIYLFGLREPATEEISKAEGLLR
jgi:hypothetical protein